MLRIADTYESVEVPERFRAILRDAPLRAYARNTWHGGRYRGEKPAAIVRTHGTDAVSECLAFTVVHLVLRVAESRIRGFDLLFDAKAEREVLRLGANFAYRLVEAVASGLAANREEFDFSAASIDIRGMVDAFRIVSQVMYPAIGETRSALANYDHEDPTVVWMRAIDHALFLPTDRLKPADQIASHGLVTLLDATIEAFYPYLLSKLLGDGVYARFDETRANEYEG